MTAPILLSCTEPGNASAPITGTGITAYRLIGRIALPQLYAGDILDVKAEAVLVNDTALNAQIVSMVHLDVVFPDPTTNGSAGGHVICRPRGPNLRSDVHYHDDTRVGHFEIPYDIAPDSAIFYRVCARSSQATTGQIITIPAGYVKLTCLIHRA